jgi:ribonuclease P protein subunit RPR2
VRLLELGRSHDYTTKNATYEHDFCWTWLNSSGSIEYGLQFALFNKQVWKMAKEKAKKGVPNKHLHARIAYLDQAVKYLSAQSLAQSHTQEPNTEKLQDHHKPVGRMTTIPPGTLGIDAAHSVANKKPSPGHPSTTTFNPPPSGLPLQLNAHLRSVAQKAQIRLSQDLKHAICKTCSSPLIEGETHLRSTENLSKGGRKSWADVLVLKCCACGACKRFPIGAKKQKRKSLREAEKTTGSETATSAMEGVSAAENVSTDDGVVAEPQPALQIRPAAP